MRGAVPIVPGDDDTTADRSIRRTPTGLLPLIGAAIIALVVANNVGNMMWAKWIHDNPIALLALNSSNKYLLGTSVVTDFWPYSVVSTLRLLAPDPLFYALGFLYGPQALHWAKRVFPGIDPVIDQFEDESTGFKKALGPLVFIAPNNPVCLLAGVAAMPIRRFMLLNITGTIGRVILFRLIGLALRDQIESVLETVARYQGWFMRVSILLVIAYLAWQVLGRRGLVGGVEALGEELGDDLSDR